jgi:hypothetical protein
MFSIFPLPWGERIKVRGIKKSYIALKEGIFLRHCEECSDVAIS